MKTYDYNDWKARAKELFGSDSDKWRFVCPACGSKQSIQDFLDLGQSRSEAVQRVHFSCIGRWTGKDGPGCDWTLGGLMSIHSVEVLMPEEEGKKIMAFEFDEPGAGPKEPHNGKKEREYDRDAHNIAHAILRYALGVNSPLDLRTHENDIFHDTVEEYEEGMDIWDHFSCECERIAKELLKDPRSQYDPGWEAMGNWRGCEWEKPAPDGRQYEGRYRICRKEDSGKLEWEWEINGKDGGGPLNPLLCGTSPFPAQCEDDSCDKWNEYWHSEEEDNEEAEV